MADERLGEAVAEGGGRTARTLRRRWRGRQLGFVGATWSGRGNTPCPPGRAAWRCRPTCTCADRRGRVLPGRRGDGVAALRLVRDFGSAEEVWGRVSPSVVELTRDERLPLDPRARSVEDEVVRLHRLLGLVGTPAHLERLAELARPAAVYGLALPASAPR